jgi:hypothetical protein
MKHTVLAYLDPGSGSVILQAVIALLVGGAFVFRQTFKTLVAWICRLFKIETLPEADPDEL